MQTIREIKQTIRKEISDLKKGNTHSFITTASASIWKQIAEQEEFKQRRTLLLYHALPDEVQTIDFLEQWYTSKCILLPVVVGDILHLKQYVGKEAVKKSAYHILEPTGEPFTALNQIELSCIPGVAFDKKGNRLGRGKGYYDKLLPNIAGLKWGICFDFQVRESLPHEEHDIQMDALFFNE
ncbi:MAG: 5-formyltetrahydrofolate cyclo-ligase [Bacteroidaceae bacterium]|nr:5-formyltetrahydrofolate cyclo-ligase [Bacteroidaceae bacterium]